MNIGDFFSTGYWIEILSGCEGEHLILTWSFYCYLLRADSDNTEQRYLPLSTRAGSVSPGRISRLVLELIGPLGKLVFLVLDMNIWLSYVSY